MKASHAKTRVFDNVDSPARTFYDKDLDFQLLNEIHKASRQDEDKVIEEEMEEVEEDMEKINAF